MKDNLKKITVIDFCEYLKENLEDFEHEMLSKNFSNRNQREWFKLLSDYLGLISKREQEAFEISTPEDENEEDDIEDIADAWGINENDEPSYLDLDD